MKRILVLAVVISLLLFACGEESVISGKFWAYNFSNSSYYRVDAQMLAENNLCRVWVEKSSRVTEDKAQRVADAYQNDIYNKMLNTFGYILEFPDEKGKILRLNTVQVANWLAKGEKYDKKLTILLLDIKDGYQQGVNESYVAGYFWSGNLLEDGSVFLAGQRSNECDMIYIDTYPGIPGSKESNETLAHEMQHLMNFVGSVAFRESATDLWIDEGLSVTAEWVYSGEHSVQRLGCYNTDVSGLLGLGNNFFVWGNRDGEGDGKSQYAVLDDYSTAYLFFQWLRLQSKKDIYQKISISEKHDYNAVIDAFNNIVSSGAYPNWESMLKDWLAANYFKSSGGRYGYTNDTILNDIKIHYTPVSLTSINLFPGEGVYSNVTESYSIPATAGKINYAGLNGSAPISSGSFSSGALLTYNANTAADGNVESGTITGKAPPANIFSATSGGRSIGVIAGPFPIGAGDMLRRKGKKGSFYPDGINLKIPDAYREIIVNE
jgi:hypothetical protein